VTDALKDGDDEEVGVDERQSVVVGDVETVRETVGDGEAERLRLPDAVTEGDAEPDGVTLDERVAETHAVFETERVPVADGVNDTVGEREFRFGGDPDAVWLPVKDGVAELDRVDETETVPDRLREGDPEKDDVTDVVTEPHVDGDDEAVGEMVGVIVPAAKLGDPLVDGEPVEEEVDESVAERLGLSVDDVDRDCVGDELELDEGDPDVEGEPDVDIDPELHRDADGDAVPVDETEPHADTFHEPVGVVDAERQRVDVGETE